MGTLFFLSFFFFLLVSIWIRSKWWKRRFDFHTFCVAPHLKAEVSKQWMWNRWLHEISLDLLSFCRQKWKFTLKIRCSVWQFVSSFMFYWFNTTQNLRSVRRFFCICYGGGGDGAAIFLALVFFVSYSLVIKWMPLAAEKKGYRSGSDAKKKEFCVI